MFPVSNSDQRLFEKERVHGIIVNNRAFVFRFEHFPEDKTVINTQINGLDIVVFGSQTNNLVISFHRRMSDETLLYFSPANDTSSIFATDNEGNLWNIFGEAVSGKRLGTRLTPTKSYIAFWFAIGAFWPGAEIYSK